MLHVHANTADVCKAGQKQLQIRICNCILIAHINQVYILH